MKKLLKKIILRKIIAKKIALTLLRIDTTIKQYLGTFLIAAEGGFHPKYEIIKYYEFFVNNIPRGSLVLDAGCGNGMLSKDIADKTHSRVVGVEIERSNIEVMKKLVAGHADIEIVHCDIWQYNDNRSFDVVVLSNILEHIDQRVKLLRHLNKRFSPKRFLIRVPLYDREWIVPYKKEHGIEWRLDPTHVIEYTEEILRNELFDSGLAMAECKKRWGEMYVVAVPDKRFI